MNYKYKPDDYTPVVGDVVLWTSLSRHCTFATANKPYIVTGVSNDLTNSVFFTSKQGDTKRLGSVDRLTLVTKPGSQAKVGDTVICVDNNGMSSLVVGETYMVHDITEPQSYGQFIRWTDKQSPNNKVECFVVLHQAEPELLHQSWKDLYDSSVELEYKSTCSDKWRLLSTQAVSYSKIVTFNNSNYEYRQKDQPLQITDYVIDVKDSSLADRLRLRQVLLDNGQKLFNNTITRCNVTMFCPAYCVLTFGRWGFDPDSLPNISLKDFIQKFKKSNQVRNLAFTSNTPEWTEQQLENICAFVGDNGEELYELNWEIEFFSDDTSSGEIFMTTTEGVPEGHLQVAYEDVFPEAVEEPTEFEFEYPIYKIDIGTGLVRKFTSIIEGVNITEGNFDSPCNKVGYVSNSSIEHTDPSWQDWNPQFDYDTVMQPNTVIHATTESEANELLYWAHQQGLKWGSGDSYLERSYWNKYNKQTCYCLEDKSDSLNCSSYGSIESYHDCTILTIDEARNGRQLPNTLYDDTIKEITMDKPLLSDLLKEHGAYEQFLTNLTVDYYNYDYFVDADNQFDAVSNAFFWASTDEGHEYWEELAEDEGEEVINDVRAPNDVDYWQSEFEAGKEVWVRDPEDGWVAGITKGVNSISPSQFQSSFRFYAEEPTWIPKPDTTTKEQTMSEPTAKVGDKVICPEGSSIGNHEPGSIETITKVDGNQIWVSNTNRLNWTLGVIWELYDGTADAGTTPITKEQTMSTNIEIKVNGKTIETGAKVSKPKSDFKLKPSVMALYHTADGAEIELKRFTGKSAAADAQAHLVTIIAEHPNAKITPYTVGKSTKIKYQFEAAK